MKLKGKARFVNINTDVDAIKFFRYSAKQANWSDIEIERVVELSGYPDAHSMVVINFIEGYFY